MNKLDIKDYSVGLVKSIKSGKLTLEEAVIESSAATGCTKNFARKILSECLAETKNKKPIKSGITYDQALDMFTSEGKPWDDYWSMQQDWTVFVDSLEKDGDVDYEEARWWDNPCTPESFNEWIGRSNDYDEIVNSRKPIKSSTFVGVDEEMIADQLEEYFNDSNYDVIVSPINKVLFEIGFNDVYVDWDIDKFYKDITNITHRFANEVLAIESVHFECINKNGPLWLLIKVQRPM